MAREGTRRRLLKTGVAGIGSLIGLSGCIGGGGDSGGGVEGDVAVGVGDYYFDPKEVSIEQGETVTWKFEAPTHNVSAVPDHADYNSVPEGAEPFASYEGDNTFETVEEGETYSHTFETPGTYEYVCVPHKTSMKGTVIVG